MKPNLPELLAGVELKPGATDAQLDAAEAAIGAKLPAVVRDFLKFTNGAWMESGEIWSVEALVDNFVGYDFHELDDFVIFGTNGGDETFGMKRSSVADGTVYAIPYIFSVEDVEDVEEIVPIARDFAEFLLKMRRDEPNVSIFVDLAPDKKPPR